MSRVPGADRRRQTRRRRLVAVVGVLGVALGIGAVCATTGGPDERAAVQRFARAWERGDWRTMRALTSTASQRRYGAADFRARYAEAAQTATTVRLTTGAPRERGDHRWILPVVEHTRAFGEVRGDVALAVSARNGAAVIEWAPDAVFPGLQPGDVLRATTTMPPRADLRARDGTPLAAGRERTSTLGAAAQAIVGSLGPIPADRAVRARQLGYPQDAQVGLSGLERIFDERLAGTPGGQLRAGVRLLASRAPRRAPAVRTSIAPSVQEAAVAALAGRYGGVVAIRPRTGEILAAAGIGFSGLQPPGSTFKVITVAGALQAGVVKPTDEFPIATSARLAGVELQNANGEACGGSLASSFAESCNSVFGPLGARLGAQRLVSAAERFGFNQPPGVLGAATSSIPPAASIGDDLAVGSSAIGQGRVQATALQMAIVSAAIGLRGRRPDVTLDPERFAGDAPTHEAATPRVARAVERLMLAVVAGGTGGAAAIEGVRVAGKTGTAELRSTQTCTPAQLQAAQDAPDGATASACADDPTDTTDTDAWFTAYAPAGEGRPRIAVAVLLVGAGAGGTTAAPAARQVLEAGLR
jgi:peptidoglycan glycosyltransferase